MVLEHLIVPATAKQTASLIFVHGLGDSGYGWKPVAELLSKSLPHVKFILPHAPSQPVTVNGGMSMPSWFDLTSLTLEGTDDEDGLLKSASEINKLVTAEVDSGIPSHRVLVGGFSQGSCLAFLVGLSSERKLAGTVALSGWLPLRHKIKSMLGPHHQHLPIFQAHGSDDPVVATKYADFTNSYIKSLGFKDVPVSQPQNGGISFTKYDGIGHGACQEELQDLAEWLVKVLGYTWKKPDRQTDILTHPRNNIAITNDGYSTYFPNLCAAYPLKLLTPALRTGPVGVGICYTLQYGGGLVSGDICDLSVDIHHRSTLILLTQGSTKVFKSSGKTSQQKLMVNVHPHATIVSLPDPIQPFAHSRYKQKQDFFLDGTSSAVILDSLNSGRSACGEYWDFDRYTSINSIYVDGHLIVKDSVHLIQPDIQTRLHPFHAYAMLFLIGEKTKSLREEFHTQQSSLNSVLNGRFDVGSRPIWSLTNISPQASVVRLAGKDDESIKHFLGERCTQLEDTIGNEAFVRCFR
ncbi:hypothetical protein E3P81_02127 [Wallemia ichthyophaga]|nr:hypothetical protein E3P97_02126 [Wallemia ichthyophaga]TIB32712.1 hypothetical protein E3P85_01675 [Wallemia ichthyophaga]TIB46562.1 hypothetical protein E3P82_02124 [Wallemia ichthyophaga]TIB50519.1 hypothetical protein E3P81_02127 [Wallemia ichthyophaga]TIB53476.1 hypothetical protein E3P80_02125 [Wallemia ichthyophaga]